MCSNALNSREKPAISIAQLSVAQLSVAQLSVAQLSALTKKRSRNGANLKLRHALWAGAVKLDLGHCDLNIF